MCGIIPYDRINIDELEKLATSLSKIANIQYNRFYCAFANSGFSGGLYWKDNPKFTAEQNKLGAAIVDLNFAVTILGSIARLSIPGAKDFNGEQIERFSNHRCPCLSMEGSDG